MCSPLLICIALFCRVSVMRLSLLLQPLLPIGESRKSLKKIKKTAEGDTPDLAFTENPDILAEVAKSARAQNGELFCIGFAAESHDLQKNAQAKREKKGVPLLVGNIGPATFGSDENALLLVDAQGTQEVPQANKLALARKLVAEIAQRMAH